MPDDDGLVAVPSGTAMALGLVLACGHYRPVTNFLEAGDDGVTAGDWAWCADCYRENMPRTPDAYRQVLRVAGTEPMWR